MYTVAKHLGDVHTPQVPIDRIACTDTKSLEFRNRDRSHSVCFCPKHSIRLQDPSHPIPNVRGVSSCSLSVVRRSLMLLLAKLPQILYTLLTEVKILHVWRIRRGRFRHPRGNNDWVGFEHNAVVDDFIESEGY